MYSEINETNKSPEMDNNTYGKMTFQSNDKKVYYSINDSRTAECQLEPWRAPYTEENSRWRKVL